MLLAERPRSAGFARSLEQIHRRLLRPVLRALRDADRVERKICLLKAFQARIEIDAAACARKRLQRSEISVLRPADMWNRRSRKCVRRVQVLQLRARGKARERDAPEYTALRYECAALRIDCTPLVRHGAVRFDRNSVREPEGHVGRLGTQRRKRRTGGIKAEHGSSLAIDQLAAAHGKAAVAREQPSSA